MSEAEKLETWALLEIFGHQRFAGMLTEHAIGSTSFVRIDVPAVDDLQPVTKLFGPSAVYAITPVTEETAMALVRELRQQPLNKWDVRTAFPELGQRTLDPEGI